MSCQGQKLNMANVVSAPLVQLPGTVFGLICTISLTLTHLQNGSRVHSLNLHTQLYFTTNVVAKKTYIIKQNLNKLNKCSFVAFTALLAFRRAAPNKSYAVLYCIALYSNWCHIQPLAHFRLQHFSFSYLSTVSSHCMEQRMLPQRLRCGNCKLSIATRC